MKKEEEEEEQDRDRPILGVRMKIQVVDFSLGTWSLFGRNMQYSGTEIALSEEAPGTDVA